MKLIFIVALILPILSCNNDSSITESTELSSDKIILLTPIKECSEFKIKYKEIDNSKNYKWAFIDSGNKYFLNYNKADSVISGLIPYGFSSLNLTLLYKSVTKQYDSIGYVVRIPFQFITSKRTGLSSIRYNVDSIPNPKYDFSDLSRISNIGTYNFADYDTTDYSADYGSDTLNFRIKVFKLITFEGEESESQLQIVIKNEITLTKFIHTRFVWLVSNYSEEMNDGVFLYNVNNNILYGRIYPHFTRTTNLPISFFVKIKYK